MPLIEAAALNRPRMAGGVAEGAEPAHRHPGDGLPVARPVARREQGGQLLGVEGLPPGAGEPVGVEPGAAALGHHDEQVGVAAQRLDVGGAGPAQVVVAAPVEQVQQGPPAVRLGVVAHREQQAHVHRLAEGGRVDRQVPGAALHLPGAEDARDVWRRRGCSRGLRCAAPARQPQDQDDECRRQNPPSAAHGRTVAHAAAADNAPEPEPDGRSAFAASPCSRSSPGAPRGRACGRTG